MEGQKHNLKNFPRRSGTHMSDDSGNIWTARIQINIGCIRRPGPTITQYR